MLKRKETFCLYPESSGAVTVKAHLSPHASAAVQSRTAAALSLAFIVQKCDNTSQTKPQLPSVSHHILKTPKRVFFRGAFRAALRLSPNTIRVSAGSMIPSSQSLLEQRKYHLSISGQLITPSCSDVVMLGRISHQ